jgi:hypothetical protein
MGPLKPGEAVSTRRLQARAAKSARARVRNLQIEISETLSGIHDEEERGRKSLELQKMMDDEKAYMAKRLTELIPTDPCSNDARTEAFRPLDNYYRTSPNEYVLNSTRTTTDEQVYSLKRKFKLTNFNELDPFDDNDLKDDEFIDAWANQTNANGYSDIDGDNSEDDDDDSNNPVQWRTVLA